MLISPERLAKLGHLSSADLEAMPHFPKDRVDFGPVIYHKTNLLNQGFEFRNPNIKDTCGCGESFNV